jgi:hypothetical protein
LGNTGKGETLMMDPRPVKRDMLVGLVDRRVSEVDLDFASAVLFAASYRQIFLKLRIIYSSHLRGVQVVAGSNPVAPTTKKD